jgi:uncharacterized protein (TIGR02246 family)
MTRTISAKAWSSFAIAAAVLLLFAVLAVRNLPQRDASVSEAPQATAEHDSNAQVPVEDTQTPTEGAPNQPAEVVVEQPADNTDRESDKKKSEVDPSVTIKNLVQAWNQGDPERLAGLFLPNGMLRLPTGTEIQSRDDIRKAFTEQRNGKLKDSRITNTVDEVSTPSDESAAVKGTYQIEGVKIVGFSINTKGSYIIEQAKRNGRWFIAKAELIRE